MNIWPFLKSLSIRDLLRLIALSARNARVLWPTWKATRRSVVISNREFGVLHRQNNPANAFRHALWNFLIARNCQEVYDEEVKLMRWVKEITDLHEEMLPNKPLAKAMDLHNNKVGRSLYLQLKDSDEEEIVKVMKSRMASSIKIGSQAELQKVTPDTFAHMTEIPQR